MFTDTTPSTVAVVDHGFAFRDEVSRALAGFLAGYSGTTVEAENGLSKVAQNKEIEVEIKVVRSVQVRDDAFATAQGGDALLAP